MVSSRATAPQRANCIREIQLKYNPRKRGKDYFEPRAFHPIVAHTSTAPRAMNRSKVLNFPCC